jgi:hypothetical protein
MRPPQSGLVQVGIAEEILRLRAFQFLPDHAQTLQNPAIRVEPAA